MDNFEGNSNALKKKQNLPLEREKIASVTDQVSVKKEGEIKKFGRQFFTEDARSVKGHIFTDVVIPGIQRLLSDIVKNGIDWLIYGVRGSSQDRGGIRNVSYRDYSSYNRNSGSSGLPTIPNSTYSRSNIYSFNEITFFDRGEAEEVLLRLREEVDRYGMVSVGDFYDMISQAHSYTDLKYGWRDLRDAEVVRAREGYSIRFPKVVPLE